MRASVHVNRHMRVLMNREGGTWKSCRRDTHMTYGHRGRRMEVLPPRYLHLYVTCSVFIYKTEHVQRCVHMCMFIKKGRVVEALSQRNPCDMRTERMGYGSLVT